MRKLPTFLLIMAASGIAGAQDLIDPAKVSSPPAASTILPTYTPPTNADRWKWAVQSTIGPASLAGGLFSAAWGTEFNRPSEYDTHWKGFGERYGLRLTGVAASNVVEAGLGAAWGEDPRYFREPDRSFGHRLRHAATMTFVAKGRNGKYMPAYARYTAIVGTNYLSNTWRPDSDATESRTAVRVGLGFLGRFSGNLWAEFWPDVKNRIFPH